MSASRELRHQQVDSKAAGKTAGSNNFPSESVEDNLASTTFTLRKGKWTVEEENYANKIIELFNQGLLPIVSGTTLRTYLSDKLRCDPMRITKKFAGASCIGKQVFQPSDDGASTVTGEYSTALNESEAELRRLEQLFLARISSKSGTNAHTTSTFPSARASRDVPSRGFYSKYEHSSPTLSVSGSSAGFVEDEVSNALGVSSQDSRISGRKIDSNKLPATNSVSSTHRNGYPSRDWFPERETSRSGAAVVWDKKNSAIVQQSINEGDDDDEEDIDLNEEENFLEAEEYIEEQKRKQEQLRILMQMQHNQLQPLQLSTAQSSSFHPSKRVRSAPNLSNIKLLSHVENGTSPRSTHIPAQAQTSRSDVTDQDITHRIAQFHDQNNLYGVSSLRSFRPGKRSHSEMALMDLEKLVADNQAAGDFFLNFIQSVNRVPTENAPGSVSQSSSVQSFASGATSISAVSFSPDTNSYRYSTYKHQSSSRGGHLRAIEEESESCQSASVDVTSEENRLVVQQQQPFKVAQESTGSISSMIGAMEASSLTAAAARKASTGVPTRAGAFDMDTDDSRVIFVDQSKSGGHGEQVTASYGERGSEDDQENFF